MSDGTAGPTTTFIKAASDWKDEEGPPTSQMSVNMNYIIRDMHERLDRAERANTQLLNTVECLVEANAALRAQLALFRGETK